MLTFAMEEIAQVMGDITNVQIRVEADVKEYFIDETRFGNKKNIVSIEMSNNENA